jgi:mannose-6-phosphate isomerase-like protein (cupin superfamily)
MLNNVRDLAIIDTHDGLLISDINSTQNVKNIYQMVKDSSKPEIRFNHIDYRPWGFYEVLAGSDNAGYKLKKITVYPNKKLSLQSHNFRKEKWTCLTGTGLAQVDETFIDLKNNSIVEIDIGQKHRLINNSETNLEIIEIQVGSYLGEDDIIRYEDDFKRV